MQVSKYQHCKANIKCFFSYCRYCEPSDCTKKCVFGLVICTVNKIMTFSTYQTIIWDILLKYCMISYLILLIISTGGHIYFATNAFFHNCDTDRKNYSIWWNRPCYDKFNRSFSQHGYTLNLTEWYNYHNSFDRIWLYIICTVNGNSNYFCLKLTQLFR